MLAHDGEEALGELVVFENFGIAELIHVAVDDGERGAELVGGVGDEVFANLLEVMGVGHVADEDASFLGFSGLMGERCDVDVPSGGAASFVGAEEGALFG